MLTKAGHEVLVETGAGQAAGFPDSQYTDKGANIGSRADVFATELLLQVRGLGANPDAGRADLDHYDRFQSVIAMCDPLSRARAGQRTRRSRDDAFFAGTHSANHAAQSMDVLSSMATVAGYRAVLLGATALPKLFPMMTTAAGTITPAKVFVMGAGVAGCKRSRVLADGRGRFRHRRSRCGPRASAKPGREVR